MYSRNDLLNDIKNLGISKDSTIMIHSAFSSIKNIDGGGKTVLSVFKEFFSDGLVILPSHTWNIMNKDNDILDKSLCNSCVGYLTNLAIKDKDFIRSNHPTHSVVAYGKNAYEYIKDDDYAISPVSPNGSFGKLKNGGYILFIGAPLSKNTFIHSIEEEMNVADRFTDHIYTFYVKDNDRLLEFHMPKHYSTLNPHISDNYEKLLPIILDKGIARRVKILDSISYLVDSKKLYVFVKEVLNNDIHAFDDLREIKYI
ncbi:MAG: AAC(3) family N-acetyltransferase [Acholeplasmatales bacterium]|nr:AAC(3) family N-acetyltransferase [Acholeplasmatales bacterium]